MSRPSSRIAAALLLAFSLTAGSAVAQTEPPATGGPNAPEAGPTEEASVESPLPGGLLVPGSEFRYDSTGRRDPFKSLLQLEKKQRDISQLPPIQQIDLETTKVIGIVIDPTEGAQAMVKSAGGQTFVVAVGTIMGRNEGEVVEISLDGIRVIEKFVDFMNRETRKETILKSHATAGK